LVLFVLQMICAGHVTAFVLQQLFWLPLPPGLVNTFHSLLNANMSLQCMNWSLIFSTMKYVLLDLCVNMASSRLKETLSSLLHANKEVDGKYVCSNDLCRSCHSFCAYYCL
jgi:hypothetical protein